MKLLLKRGQEVCDIQQSGTVIVIWVGGDKQMIWEDTLRDTQEALLHQVNLKIAEGFTPDPLSQMFVAKLQLKFSREIQSPKSGTIYLNEVDRRPGAKRAVVQLFSKGRSEI